MSKFKVGDKVRIKKDLVEGKNYKSGSAYGRINSKGLMDKYFGEETEVEKVLEKNEYQLKIDKNDKIQRWTWYDGMLEKVKEKKPKFKIGDKVKLIKSWRHKKLHGIGKEYLKEIEGKIFTVYFMDSKEFESITLKEGICFYYPTEIFHKVKESKGVRGYRADSAIIIDEFASLDQVDPKQKFNVGDKVRLVKNYNKINTYGIGISELDKLKDKVLTVKEIIKSFTWDKFYPVILNPDCEFIFSSALLEKVEETKPKKVKSVDKDLMELYESKIKLYHEGCIVRIDSTNTYGIVEKILPGSFLIKIPSVLTTRFVEYKLSDLTILS